MDKELEEFLARAQEVFGVSIKAETLDEAKAKLREAIPEERRGGDVSAKTMQLEKPKTLDEKGRTVECIIASEAPYVRYDWWEEYFYEEILLMDGCQLQGLRNGTIPFIDSHDYWHGTKSLLGTTKDIHIEGDKLVGTRVFSNVPEAERVFTLIKEGHLQTQSIGYRIAAYSEVKPNSEREVMGVVRKAGKLAQRYITNWTPIEDSAVVFPADPSCGVREDEFLGKISNIQQNKQKEGTKEMAENTKTIESATPSAPVIDEAQIKEKAIQEERERNAEITAICRNFDIESDEFIKNGMSVEDVRKAVLEELAKRNAKTAPTNNVGTVQVVTEMVDKVRAAAIDGLLMTKGAEIENPAVGANDFIGITPVKLARSLLAARGERLPETISGHDLFERAMFTGDFPKTINAAGERFLQKGFDEAAENYTEWVDDSGVLPNWREKESSRIVGKTDLLEVMEGEESKFVYFNETGDKVKLQEFARKVAMTERCFDNDDFGEFFDKINDLGGAARRVEADLVYDYLINNPNLADGNPLFGSAHKNLATSSAKPTLASLSDAMIEMATQTDVDGSIANIKPQYLVAPLSLSPVIDTLLNSASWADADAAATRKNVLYHAIRPVYDVRLDVAFKGGALPWFMAARKGQAIKLYKLASRRSPRLFRTNSYDTRSIQFDINYAVTAHVEAYQGLYKNAGAI